jgi:hypothetical protein
MGMAWDKVNDQEDTTQQRLEMTLYGFSATIARIWKPNFHHAHNSRSFYALTMVTNEKTFPSLSRDWLAERKGATG